MAATPALAHRASNFIGFDPPSRSDPMKFDATARSAESPGGRSLPPIVACGDRCRVLRVVRRAELVVAVEFHRARKVMIFSIDEIPQRGGGGVPPPSDCDR